MRKKKEMSLNVGTSSILFIFVILCLISFAILSLASAMSDYRLSSRVATNTKAYYTACNDAEEALAQTDATLKRLYDTGISRTGYYDQVGKTKSFAFDISDIQYLNVEIKILYPAASGEEFYEITSWQVVTTKELEYDETLPVFK